MLLQKVGILVNLKVKLFLLLLLSIRSRFLLSMKLFHLVLFFLIGKINFYVQLLMKRKLRILTCFKLWSKFQKKSIGKNMEFQFSDEYKWRKVQVLCIIHQNLIVHCETQELWIIKKIIFTKVSTLKLLWSMRRDFPQVKLKNILFLSQEKLINTNLSKSKNKIVSFKKLEIIEIILVKFTDIQRTEKKLKK